MSLVNRILTMVGFTSHWGAALSNCIDANNLAQNFN
jgi:hypothetical protein